MQADPQTKKPSCDRDNNHAKTDKRLQKTGATG